MFGAYLERWRLEADGDPLRTRTSALLPVRRHGELAMLKVALHDEERRGAALMAWWNGEGAARVLAQAGDAILLERADGKRSLVELARGGRDNEATRIICAAVARLHAPRPAPPAGLTPLAQWFAPLTPAAQAHGGILHAADAAASALLAAPCDVVVLHGDIHHGNILHFGSRGWLAIDPKGLCGERGFDYANLLCNPDLETAAAPGRLARRSAIAAQAAALDRGRLLNWVLAWAGLSAAFQIEDGLPPHDALAIAELAAAELDR